MTWWQWLLAAYIVLVVLGFAAVFFIAANRAPMDTDIWPGGEPK